MKKSKSPFSVLKRLIDILSLVSDSTGRKIGTVEIQKQLEANGVNVSLRTVQRDLRLMQRIGLPICVDEHQPMGAKIDKNNAWLKNLLQSHSVQQIIQSTEQ